MDDPTTRFLKDIVDDAPPRPMPPQPMPFRPISPQPMPLSPIIRKTTLDGNEIKRLSSSSSTFRFESILFVPDVMEPAIEPRLRKAFPELSWEDRAENWDKVRIEGALNSSVVISVVRNEPPGDFRLTITVTAPDQPEAEKCHREFVRRLSPALTGWSLFTLPKFKPRPPSGINIDQEEVVDLFFPLERGQVRLFQPSADILVSRILLEVLSARGEVLDSAAKNPEKYPSSVEPEGRAESLRGARARLILAKAVPVGGATAGEDLEVDLALVRQAHSLVGELLETGWAQLVRRGPGGSAETSPRRITVRYFGTRMAPTAGFGFISYSDASGEFLRLNWWVS